MTWRGAAPRSLQSGGVRSDIFELLCEVFREAAHPIFTVSNDEIRDALAIIDFGRRGLSKKGLPWQPFRITATTRSIVPVVEAVMMAPKMAVVTTPVAAMMNETVPVEPVTV
jgi:hypothetical protein